MNKWFLFLIFSCLCMALRGQVGESQWIDSVRHQYAPDKRVALFEVNCSVEGNKRIVKGMTTSQEAKQVLLRGLREKGYEVIDSLKILPDTAQLGTKTYGIVNLSVCNLLAADDFAAEMVSQGLLGTPVRVLLHGNFYRIQTPDRYLSWVHRAGIRLMTKEEYEAWNKSEKVIVTSHYGFAYSRPNEHSQVVSDVVSGDRLKYLGRTGGFYKVEYPDGRVAYLSQFDARMLDAWNRQVKQDAKSIIQTAYTLMGTPYLWGGMSSKGTDCSGFVRTVLYLHNIILPRDASQQAYIGQRIEIKPWFVDLQPGDLIFFGKKATLERKERVSHVGIYIGNEQFIHSMGDVHVSSFDPADANYDAYNLNRVLFAVRFLPYIGQQQGVETVDNNVFYK